jgi:Topoisomerase IA
MKRYLIIAEKKSIRQYIQDVYDKNKGSLDFVADITFMANPVSHVSDKVIPVNPNGVWKKLVLKNTKVPEGFYVAVTQFLPIQIEEIATLIKANDYDFVINASDPDLYGQLSYEYTKENVGFSLPDKRMWYRDLTEKEILRSLLSLEDNNKILADLLSKYDGTGLY